jgi:hypothetical protein
MHHIMRPLKVWMLPLVASSGNCVLLRGAGPMALMLGWMMMMMKVWMGQ